MKICIFGAASYEIDKTYSADTRKLCKNLAEKGHSLVFGAGGNGLMGAAAEGFKTGGGEIVGVIPHFFRDENIEKIYSECTEIIFTDTIVQRKSKMEELADAFIIVPGDVYKRQIQKHIPVGVTANAIKLYNASIDFYFLAEKANHFCAL